eukprot:jgi/Undpi1/3917/HiC_scaffold_16.g07285.m1
MPQAARRHRDIPPELEDELFSRNRFFFQEGFENIRDALVIVVGLGGVGSHAAHMLVRSGVKKLRVIDFDQVTLSSLNRHAVATWEDVGRPKALVLRDRLHAIIPNARIDARVSMFKKREADLLLDIDVPPGHCFVLDCIDDLATKAELIEQCSRRGLRVLSSMGAGLKSDPTRLHIAKLADCSKDRLAMRLRAQLKKAHGVDAGTVECVYSSEEQVVEMLPLSKEQKKNPEEFGVVDNFRVRVLPVLGTTPAIFGQTMVRQRATRCNVRARTRWTVWRGRCPATGRRALGSNCLEICRWDRSPDGPGCVPSNLVVLSLDVAKRLDSEGTGCVDPAVRAKIEATLAAERSDYY